MNSSKRGRTIALFTGAGVIGIAVVALVFWKDLVAHYHLYRLRSDPDYLREIIRADEESPEHEAIHAHLDSQEGQQQLFDLYLPTVVKIKERATFVSKRKKVDSSRHMLRMRRRWNWKRRPVLGEVSAHLFRT